MSKTKKCSYCNNIIVADTLGRFRRFCYQCARGTSHRDPTPDEIAQRCAEIREEWDERTHRQRFYEKTQSVGDMVYSVSRFVKEIR